MDLGLRSRAEGKGARAAGWADEDCQEMEDKIKKGLHAQIPRPCTETREQTTTRPQLAGFRHANIANSACHQRPLWTNKTCPTTSPRTPHNNKTAHLRASSLLWLPWATRGCLLANVPFQGPSKLVMKLIHKIS